MCVQADALGQEGVTVELTEHCFGVRCVVLDMMLLGTVWSATACLTINICADLDAFVQKCLDHALLEAQDSPAAKHNHSQLAEAKHSGVDCLQHGQHYLHCELPDDVLSIARICLCLCRSMYVQLILMIGCKSGTAHLVALKSFAALSLTQVPLPRTRL